MVRFNFTVCNVTITYEQQSSVGPGRGSLNVSQRHGRRVHVGERLVIPYGHRERERSGVDVEDDAEARWEGIRTERERDARRRSIADDALVIVARRARVEDELGHAHDVARYDSIRALTPRKVTRF